VTVNRSEAGMLAVLPALVFAAAVGVENVHGWNAIAVVGAISAVLPVIGRVRDELAVLGWIPGLFFGFLLFLLSGISRNPLPGPLGDLAGGWAVLAPLFVAGALFSRQRAPGSRSVLVIIGLLASVAVLFVASYGPYGSPTDFAEAFAQVPRAQADVLGSILTGGNPTTAPFVAVGSPVFALLVLLAGAGAIVGLLAVDPERDPEYIGFEGPAPRVPAGTYRTLFPDGRQSLTEATPSSRPGSAEPSTLVSVVAATAAAIVSLTLASAWPNALIPGTAAVLIALLAATLLAFRGRGSLESPSGPAPAAAPSERI
jgi:hypothetical protein